MSNHEIEVIEPAAEEVVPFVPLLEVAIEIGVEPTTIRRWIWKGESRRMKRSFRFS